MLESEASTRVDTREGSRTGAGNSQAVDRGLEHLQQTQHPDGSWHGDYGGPLFLQPLYIAACHVAGLPIDPSVQKEMLRYQKAHQNPDGGFGLHVEASSSVFPSVLNYVAARLLGEAPDASWLSRTRAWLEDNGGPTHSAAWGKYFLAVLNLYDYRGLAPVLPELWLLPTRLPFHPSRLWCHCRMVYLPLSYLYGGKRAATLSPILRELRRELYPQGYDQVDWDRARDQVAPADSLSPRSPLLDVATRWLRAIEARCPRPLRAKALDYVLDQIRREDENTHYICIGPINKLLHVMVWYFERPGGPELEQHAQQMSDYLYAAADGVKMNGYDSSRLWDTAFAAQVIARARPNDESRALLGAAFTYLEAHQVLEDVPEKERCFRHASKGGWPFSSRAHGWPISDCTAEGLKACLAISAVTGQSLPRWRLDAAVELMLSLQNEDGGWATYELTRGPAWLEALNASDCFREIMIDYSYVECTSACMQALAAYRRQFGHAYAEPIESALARGRRFLESVQRVDGSFEGSWGVCFTYGTWFGVLGLKAAGVPDGAAELEKACAFLRAHQRADGSWGESPESCVRRHYVPTEAGQAVMTAWATLALIAAGQGQSSAVSRGADFLRKRQRADGSFPPEGIAGVFNKTCAIHYDNYLKIFPLWALIEAERCREPALGEARKLLALELS
ncbi:MAG TPA: terpene cyclase/mutase family protein [Polyangiaceae bacterium]|nr:terpene cyclase/mutase family protein [Polyangiaceae bacterium]